MCGKGDACFNGVELRQIAGGYAAVPSTPAKIGWVYKDCVINGESAKLKYEDTKPATAESADGNYTLGRPWGQGTPVAVFIDTKMNVVPSATGWSEMSGGYPARFAEYNSTTSTGSVIDLSGRKTTFAETHENNPVLTAEEAAAYSDMSKMFGEWDPTLATEQAPVPTGLQVSGMTLTWNTSDYALLWAVCKDGTVIDFTTDNTYTAAETGSYRIRAANEMGGLSEASEAVTVNGSTTVIIPAKEKTTYVTATALDFSNVAGMKAYIAVRATETKVGLQEAGAVPAETPLVLIVETPKQEYTIPAATSADAVTGNLLKAGDGATVIGGASRYDYVLKDGVFRRAAEGTVDKGKAYLHLEADQLPNATAAAELTISFGETTGIRPITGLSLNDGEWYDLSGRKLTQRPTTKGVYIVNGQKVIIK
jgi:RNase P/RNase MRP subunit p29